MSRKHTAKLVLNEGQQQGVIVQYIKKNTGGKMFYADDGDEMYVPGNPQRVGVMVAVKMPLNGYGIGFTLANQSHNDAFDPQTGVGTAISRALGYQETGKVPDSMTKDFVEFMERARAYYKNVKLVNCPEL